MDVIAFFSSGILRSMLLEDGFSPDCPEILKIDALSDGQDVVLLVDGSIGYYDERDDFHLLF